MSLVTPSKNVFDATIGDGTIKGKRMGRVAMASPEAQRYFADMQLALRHAKLEEHEISAADRSRDIVVSVKIRISFNKKDYTQKLQLSKMGDYKPSPPSEPIDISKDTSTKKLCQKIAEEVHRITGATNWAYTKSGNPIPPEDVILRQVREVLRDDIRNANSRLVKDIVNLLHEDHFILETQKAFEDMMRDRVHTALAEFERISPETMHKFVDEMYCKKIHDS